MKITSVLILIFALHVSATGVAQKISFSGENVPLTKVFNAIEDQLGFGVLMPHKLMESAKPVTVKVENGTLDELLQKCFEFQPWKLSYTITGHTIYVFNSPISPIQTNAASPIPNTVNVSGVVYDEATRPLSAANVKDENSSRITFTNAKGEFKLPHVQINSILTITFVGYAAQNIKIKDSANIQVFLKSAKNELDKVVVQAYGLTTARLTTGNISTVTAEQIERQPVMNILSALQGEVPGLVVTQTSGYASAPFKVEIRGRAGINPNLVTEPLYIIDGVPLTIVDYGNNGNYATGSVGFTQNGFTGPAGGQSPLFSINPNDVESVTVLKDADATSIYGSRGANGVILITTKSGKPGKAKFDLSANEGVTVVTNHYKLMNTPQYLQMRNEAFKNDGVGMNIGNAYDLLQWDTTRYTDWQKAIWGRTGQVADIEAALSGGEKQTTYRLAGNFHRNESILAKSGADQRSNVQFNIIHKSLDLRLTTSFTAEYSYLTDNLISNPDVVLMAPNAPAIFNSEGQLNYAAWGPVNSPGANYFQLFGALLRPYTASTGYLNSRVAIKYELIKGLVISVSAGYSTFSMQQKQFTPIAAQDPRLNPVGSSEFGNNYGVNEIAEPTIEYRTATGKGKLDVLFGASDQIASSSGNSITGQGFTNDALLGSVSNAPTIYGSNGSADYKYAAIYGRANYNWADKYILNLSARRDGSSRFGPGHQYGNFASAGAAWIFSEEPFIKNTFPFLSFGKLRGSYGNTGSDEIGNYQYLSQWSASGTIPYQPGGSVSYVSQLLANPNLVWQSNHKLEAAIDLGFSKDRLLVELARYQDRCGNQLISFILPVITGFNNVTANFPATVQNLGWESTVKYKFADSRTFTGTLNFNIGINRNTLLKYPGIAQSPYAAIYTVGEPLNIVRLLHYTGVDPLTGQYSYKDKIHAGGGYNLINYYNNGVNDLYDHDLSVKYDGGFGADLRYKSISLDLFFHFRNVELPSSVFTGIIPGNLNGQSNQSTKVLNRWQKPGDAAPYARYTTGGQFSDGAFQTSDGDYCNGSYIRLQNLSLSYDLPGLIAKKSGIQSCKIYARGENLLLITRYDGIDPQTPGLGTLPPGKTFVCGIQFTF